MPLTILYKDLLGAGLAMSFDEPEVEAIGSKIGIALVVGLRGKGWLGD